MIEKYIYYHDTDAGGVVYYGNYLKYLEEARTELMMQKGISIKEMHSEGFLYAVRECNVTYKSPARYGDIIICDATIDRLTASQIIFKQTVKEKTTNRLIVEAEVYLVSLSKEFKATPIPDHIRARLTA